MDYPFDLGRYSRPSSEIAEAQVWCDRGMVWLFGYNHEEAVACFQRALEADPGCAMAHWGVGYAGGPNYNMPWERRDANMRRDSLAVAFDAAESYKDLFQDAREFCLVDSKLDVEEMRAAVHGGERDLDMFREDLDRYIEQRKEIQSLKESASMGIMSISTKGLRMRLLPPEPRT